MGFIIGQFVEGRVSEMEGSCCEGTVTIFQYGAGPNGVMRTLGKYMLGSGGMFGYVFPPC